MPGGFAARLTEPTHGARDNEITDPGRKQSPLAESHKSHEAHETQGAGISDKERPAPARVCENILPHRL